MGGEAVRRLVEGLLPPLCDHGAENFPGLFDLLVGLGRFGPENGNEPVKIRVGEVVDEPAGAAGAARFLTGLSAEDELSQPKREALLADALGSYDQKDLGQLAGCAGGREGVSGGLMANER